MRTKHRTNLLRIGMILIIIPVVLMMYSCQKILVTEYIDGKVTTKRIRLTEKDKQEVRVKSVKTLSSKDSPFSDWTILEQYRDPYRGDLIKKTTILDKPQGVADDKFTKVRREEIINPTLEDSIINTIVYVEGELLVEMAGTDVRKSNEIQRLNNMLNGVRVQDISFIPNTNIGLLKYDFEQQGLLNKKRLTEDLTTTLTSSPGILRAEPNYIYSLDIVSNDPAVNQVWGLNNTGQLGGVADADIDAFEAWDITVGDNSILVGVIDTGIDYNHEDLVDNIWVNPGEVGADANGNDKRNNGVDDDGNGYIDDYRGWNFYNNNNDPFDSHGHGTHVGGTIAARGNNSIGISGVAWEASLVGIKFLGANGGTTYDAIASVKYATSLGVDLTNNSWGGGGFSQLLMDAIKEAGDQDILFVAAAGNSTTNTDNVPHYPSSYTLDNIVSVVATDNSDQISWFSNYGSVSTDLGAPGSNIYSTLPNNTYGYLSGTSMAAPAVAGVIVLIKSHLPGLSKAQIKSRLLQLADKKSSLNGKCASGSRLNAYGSLQSFTSDSAPVGSITAYTGSLALIPDNWMICDGREITDPNSVLYGTKTPNLVERFLMGNDVSASFTYGGLNQTPNHSHSYYGSTNNVYFLPGNLNGYASQKAAASWSFRYFGGETFSQRHGDYLLRLNEGSHGHKNGYASISGNTYGGGSHDNRPAYFSVVYLIKIK